MIKIIDLYFLEQEKLIASFLLETQDGLALVETGPDSTFPMLKAGIERHGYHVEDVKHVFLTHIHLDHSGGAFNFVKHGATFYVHPTGVPHLANPEKLYASASRIYRNDMDRFWGKVGNIPESQIQPLQDGEIIALGDHKLIAHHTPGHASHHIAFQLQEIVFAGDLAGVCLLDVSENIVDFACPPPELDMITWNASIQKILDKNPAKLYLTHYGIIQSPKDHFKRFNRRAESYFDFLRKEIKRRGFSSETISPAQREALTDKFIIFARNSFLQDGASEKQVERLFLINPPYMTVMGILRSLKNQI